MADKTTGKLKLWIAKITDKISDTINIYLSENFSKIDDEFSSLKDDVDEHKAEDASTTTKGHVQLNNTVTSTSTSLAATASAVKTVNDALTSHKADGTQHAKTARFVVGTSTSGWTEKDCDYLCDGTNDQEEIIQALNDLPATGGEVVILDGTYNITASINIPKDNVSIRGSGNATTLKRMYNSTGANSGPTARGVITLNEKSGCKIQGLQIDGNRATYTASYNFGICLSSSSNNTVTGNTCNNSSGIYMYSSSNNTVIGNTCNNNNNGISLDSSSNNNIVTGNTCNNNNNGIYLDSSSDNTVTGNTCNNNSYGICMYSSSDNTVTGNTCDNNSYGIELFLSRNNTVTGNTCIRGTGTPEDYTTNQYTILLSGTSNSYNLISSNNCMGKAPVVEGGTGNTVFNNKWDESSDFEDLKAEVIAHKAETKKKSEVSITDFESQKVGDDWFPAFQAALATIGNTGSIKFPGKTTYNMYSPMVLPLTGHRIKLYSNDGATIRAMHNGDAIVLNAQNENYSAHILEGLVIQGPNASYPADGYVPPSTGAGVRMNTAYYCTLRDVRIMGFKYGVHLKSAIKNNFEGNTYIRFNQYGVYFDGGATNVNNFKGIGIRENRKAGVYFKTTLTGPFPTHNTFSDCIIESNIPYPIISGGNAPNDSIGVYLGGAYYNIFDNCYFENHQYAVYITGSSDGNKFSKCRFSPSGDLSRLDKVMFDGPAVNNNTFTECISISQDSTSANVESNHATQFYNQFINCEGFNFIPASILAPIDIINNRPNQAGWGTPFGALSMPLYGICNNPGEGTTRGSIDGIGTTNATLNAEGYGEVLLGAAITSPTTITRITGLRKGQFFMLTNYQTNHPVTIKSSTDGIFGIVLLGRKDAVLRSYSDSILFWVTQLGKIIEVGRNIVPQVFATHTWDVPSLIDGAGVTSENITVPGANMGDRVIVSYNQNIQGLSVFGWVSAPNTVNIRVENHTGATVDLPNGNFYIEVGI